MEMELTKEEVENIVRSEGYPSFIADMIIEQYNPRFRSITDFKKDPVVNFNLWRMTKEGSVFWKQISDNRTDWEHCLAIFEMYNLATPEEKPQPKQKELVDHPVHYKGKDNPYEVRKVISDWNLNFNLGNVVKYIGRLGAKDAEIQELRKARNYIDFEIERIQKLKQQNGNSINNIS